MSRDQLIQLLVVDALEHAGDAGRYRWLERVLERGWRGFSSMNDKELADEARQRGIEADDEGLAYADNSADNSENIVDYDSEVPQLIASYAIADTGLDFV